MNNSENKDLSSVNTETASKTTVDDAAVKTKREPLFHIVKRSSINLKKSLAIRVGAILIALLIVGIITLIILKQNPFTAYKTMFIGVFGDNTLISFRDTAILLCVALALTPAFKMRFWNTGAEGQVIAGALASAFCLYNFYSLPTPLLIIVMFLASVLMGGLWGAIPAIFKAFWGTNETLFTLMMNSIAAYLTLFAMKFWNKTSNSVGKEILDPDGKINAIFGSNYWLIIGIVLLIDVIMFVYLKYSKHGYEISVVGESENTAKYIGINVKKVIIRTMVISGLICGIAGFLIVAPAQNISNNIAEGRGFTAIMVAWLAKFNPLIMILSAFLFIFVSSGGREISTTLGFEAAYSDILIGILLFFIIGCEFFINYKLVAGTRVKSFIEKIKSKFKRTGKETSK
ncbi:MAG: ABC transporter permease [Clostridia bacterium]|nr:ABC transporter permease [Clostridia bacterium]